MEFFRSSLEGFAMKATDLAQQIAEILAENLGCESTFFSENCLPSSCYIRINRYPACPVSSKVFGLIPHTDSDFLTVLHQDQVGGLQLLKDGKWIRVKPNPDVLVINIGDLFQVTWLLLYVLNSMLIFEINPNIGGFDLYIYIYISFLLVN